MFENYEAEKKAKAVEDHVKQSGKYATIETVHIEQNRADESPKGMFPRLQRFIRRIFGR